MLAHGARESGVGVGIRGYRPCGLKECEQCDQTALWHCTCYGRPRAHARAARRGKPWLTKNGQRSRPGNSNRRRAAQLRGFLLQDTYMGRGGHSLINPGQGLRKRGHGGWQIKSGHRRLTDRAVEIRMQGRGGHMAAQMRPPLHAMVEQRARQCHGKQHREQEPCRKGAFHWKGEGDPRLGQRSLFPACCWCSISAGVPASGPSAAHPRCSAIAL